VIRALEVFETGGRPLSWWHARERAGAAAAGERWIVLELLVEPHRLNRRIRERSRAMFAGGLLAETRTLLDAGHGEALAALRAIGYDEALDVLAGRLTVPQAEKRTSLRTRQLAKRQRTWFRHQEEAIRLTAGDRTTDELCEAALATLAAWRPGGGTGAAAD
jgi:tRNA dimethylallyltransferase